MTEEEELALAEAEAEAWKNRKQPDVEQQPLSSEQVQAATTPSQPANEPGLLAPQSTTGAAVRGFAQGGSYGFGDELGGVMAASREAATRSPSMAAGGLGLLANISPAAALLGAGGAATGLGEAADERPGESPFDAIYRAYREGRWAARAEDRQARESHPVAYFAGDLAGTAAAPGPKLAAGTKIGAVTLRPAGAAAASGVLQGGAAGVGVSDGDIGDAVKSGLMGAGLGGVAGAALGALSEPVSRWLRKRSEENALKAIGVRAGISSQLERRGYESAAEARQLGKEALDQGLVRPFSTAESVARDAQAAKQHYGAMIEDALRQGAEAGGKMDMDRAAWDAVGAALGPNGLTAAGYDKARGAARMVKQISDQGANDASFAAANRLKSDLYDAIDFANNVKLKSQIEQRAAGGLRNSIENQLREAAGDQAADQLASANRRYGPLIDIQALAREEANRQLERKGGIGLKEMAAASAGATAAGPAGVLAAPAMSLWGSLVSPRMPSTMASIQRAATPLPGKLAPLATRETTETAWSEFRRRFGVDPKDDEEVADRHFIESQRGGR